MFVSDCFSAFVVLPFYLLVVSVKLWYLVTLLLKWKFPLSEIPGPNIASWTRLWWMKTLYHGQAAQELLRLNKEYGPVVRISPRSIIVSDPDTTRGILAVGSRYRRGPWFDTLRLSPLSTNIVSERDPKKHQDLRGIFGPGLSGKGIFDIEKIIDDHVGQWLDDLERKCRSTKSNEVTSNLSRSIPFLTLDVITHLCLGKSFRCLETDCDTFGFLDALQSGMKFQQYASSLPELNSLIFFLAKLPWLRSHIFPNTSNENGIGRVMRLVEEIVKVKLATPDAVKTTSRADMLDMFLLRGLSLEQAANELVVVLYGGAGSTAYAAQGVIRCIVANPQVYCKVQHEIDDMTRNIPTGGRVSNSAIKEMRYLSACISEGLRMYPPICQLREHIVPPEGAVLHGYQLPRGSIVGFNTLASQRHHVYGESPEQFQPERWLINDHNRLKEMYRNLDLVFSYGSSRCLGVGIANVELNKIIFELFRYFKVSFENPDHPWKARGDFILSDFSVKINRRNIHRSS